MCDDFLSRNALWAESVRQRDPELFARTAASQAPSHLWIGCSDSRLPAATITGAGLGELFVHRNIANLCRHTDPSMLAVLEYAVDVLAVEHIVVCGHHGCGGVAAALARRPVGQIDNWLRHIRDVFAEHETELEAIPGESRRIDRLCELNALAQARHVAETSIVQRAWARGQDLSVHAWIYRLRDGRLRDLGDPLRGAGDVAPAQRLDFG